MAARLTAQSATVRASGPMWSRVQDSGSTPALETLPYVGFKPAMPHNAAGILIEPPVSLPRAIATIPAATAAPDPPDEPPGMRLDAHGLDAGEL